jgi:hypothetical protein
MSSHKNPPVCFHNSGSSATSRSLTPSESIQRSIMASHPFQAYFDYNEFERCKWVAMSGIARKGARN